MYHVFCDMEFGKIMCYEGGDENIRESRGIGGRKMERKGESGERGRV